MDGTVNIESMPKERKVVSVKKYTVKVVNYSNGTESMHRTNDGFKPLEVLGLCEYISREAREMMAGRIKPDVITRKVINRNNKD